METGGQKINCASALTRKVESASEAEKKIIAGPYIRKIR